LKKDTAIATALGSCEKLRGSLAMSSLLGKSTDKRKVKTLRVSFDAPAALLPTA